MKISTLEAIFNTLNIAKSKYLVAGGLAVNIHGYQRMTADLDIVIQLDSANVLKTMDNLEKLGYQPIIPVNASEFANPDMRKTWIETKNMQVLSLQSDQHKETTIDIFVTEPFDFENEYKNAKHAELTDTISFRVVNIPTLIKMKQDTGRAKDLDDIAHLNLILESSND